MTLIDSEGLEATRIRVAHLEREMTQIKMRLRALPLAEPLPLPVERRKPPFPESKYYCSFCGKGQEDVAVLVAGPGNFICNECVTLCHEIVQKRLNEAGS